MKAEAKVKVPNASGLHARPAAIFVETASSFDSEIEIKNLSILSEWMDAKSILSLLALGVEQNHQVMIRAEGEDAQKAVDTLVNLVLNDLVKYDES